MKEPSLSSMAREKVQEAQMTTSMSDMKSRRSLAVYLWWAAEAAQLPSR